MTLEVEAIHRAQEMALLSSGQVVPITNWFDMLGEDSDPDLAVSCVAGEDGIGWFSINLSDYEKGRMQ